MAWTLCTSGAAIFKAGKNVNATAVDYSNQQTEIDEWSEQAEGRIEAATGKSYVANVAGLNGLVSGAVANVCSSMIAMKMIAYTTTGYITREADTLLNVHDNIITKGLNDLERFEKIKLKNPTT